MVSEIANIVKTAPLYFVLERYFMGRKDDPYALDFAWDQAIINTVLEKAERKTKYIDARAICQDCGNEFDIDNLYDECPTCSSYMKELKCGRELRVKSLTVI